VSRDFSSENIFRRIGSLVERPPIKMTQLVKVPVNMLGTKSSIGGCPEVPDNADEQPICANATRASGGRRRRPVERPGDLGADHATKYMLKLPN